MGNGDQCKRSTKGNSVSYASNLHHARAPVHHLGVFGVEQLLIWLVIHYPVLAYVIFHEKVPRAVNSVKRAWREWGNILGPSPLCEAHAEMKQPTPVEDTRCVEFEIRTRRSCDDELEDARMEVFSGVGMYHVFFFFM